MALLEAHRLPFDNFSNSNTDTHHHSDRYWQETLLHNAMNPPTGGVPPDNFNAPIPSSSGPTQEGSVSGKKRKAGKPKPLGEIRRVASTPQIRGIPMNDQIPPSPTAADKRRSKLGYHRSSVACTHCRKRKIRCILPTPPDPAGRCSHCIRLKKECKFEGVNESSPVDTKAKRSGPPSASDPTSPQASSHASGLQDEAERSYPHNPQLDTSFTGVPMYQDSPRGYGYPPAVGPDGWNQEGMTSPTESTSYQREDANSPYWSPTQATHPAGFHHATVMSNAGAYGHPAYASQPGQPAWAAQPRSMSLGNVEQMHQQYQYQQAAGYDQQQSSDRSQYPPQQLGQPMGLPAPPQIPQTYPYPPQDWQRYQMAGAEQNARERSTYQYPAQYYASQPAQQNEAMPPPPNMAYPHPSGYYPPASQHG